MNFPAHNTSVVEIGKLITYLSHVKHYKCTSSQGQRAQIVWLNTLVLTDTQEPSQGTNTIWCWELFMKSSQVRIMRPCLCHSPSCLCNLHQWWNLSKIRAHSPTSSLTALLIGLNPVSHYPDVVLEYPCCLDNNHLFTSISCWGRGCYWGPISQFTWPCEMRLVKAVTGMDAYSKCRMWGRKNREGTKMAKTNHIWTSFPVLHLRHY